MIKLGDVISLDKTKKVDIQDNVEYTIAGVQSYGKGVLNKRKELGINMTMKQYQLIESNQLMWCKVDTKNGAFGITKSEHKGSLASTNMCLAKIKTDKILPEFLEKLFRIKFFHENITHLSSGTTNRKYLTPNQLCELIYIPNFTIQEQKDFLQFVNKLESSPIFSHIDFQLTQLENLNQAILQEAVQGKLVEQDPKDEPASELLKRILALSLSKGKQKKPLPPIKPEEIPFEIPENWVWCRLGEISEIKRGKGPKYSENGIPKMLNQKCVRWYEVDLQYCKSIDADWFNSISEDFVVSENDVLVNSTGDGTIGRSAIAHKEVEGYIYDSHILKITSIISQMFICYYINSNYGQEQVNKSKGATSTKQHELGVNNLSNFTFPLPPLSEQKRLVAEIEKQFAKTKQLKEHIIANQQATEQLLKALLHQAFEVKEMETV